MKKKILIPAFLGTFFLVSCSENVVEKMESKEMSLEQASSNDEAKSLEIYENIENAFTSHITRSSTTITYPDYYGGSYIDNYGKLVILVKDTSAITRNNLRTCAKTSDFTTEACEYSFNELNEVNDSLGKLFENKNLREELAWEGVGTDVMENKVVIYLKDCSETSIERFKQKVMNSPMLRFEKEDPIQWDSECIPTDSIVSDARSASFLFNLHLGSAYHLTGKTEDGQEANFVGSVGFRAMAYANMEKVHGFVTAAHCLPKYGMKIYQGRNEERYLGTVTNVVLNKSSDAAFVTVDYDTFYPTNCAWVTKTPIADEYVKNASLVNYHVITEGQKSAMRVLSLIAILNRKVHIQEWTAAGQVDFVATNMISATFYGGKTEQGDSGAIVYTDSSYGSSYTKVVGVHCGHSGSNQYLSSADLISQDLYLSNGWVK